MEKITFNDYKNAIQSHYEIKKNEDITGILLHPSPAQLRNYCSLLLDNGLTPKDEAVFRNFFETKNGESLKKSIENCNTDKFRTIISFLKEKRDSEISLRVELAAVLIDFKPRPYHAFQKTEVVTNEISNAPQEMGFQENISALAEYATNFNGNPIKSNFKKKVAFGLMGLIGITSIGYTTKNTLFKNKECMQWQINHYEYVDCDQKALLRTYPILPVDESLINLKKIEVNNQTVFFRNGKPVVWYCKHKNKVTFYNSYGFDPETGKPLKPITKYMIKKYVK
ncbi:hypothetical protein [Flavobacterium difficile]|uniref:Uncharacterized protein n=1 Tax=Flavobacterium difficile TaxID=2709659 RepID=A0ABX0I7Z5_9FLAO|nr:hypothetical protein [Flavobacterium difficile]NHM01576.1 hypothetical protein [Flavobacterium difficile]